MGENNVPAGRQPSKRGKVSAAVAPLLGAAAVLLGCLIAYVNRDFTGWIASAPLSNKTFTANGAAFITQGTQIGLVIMIVGLLVLAYWVGYRLGRQTSSSQP
jgi:hypothetical protein